MTLLYMAGMLVCCTGNAADRVAADFAFYSQATVAAHDDSSHHSLPCIARLSDGRLLLVWSRYAPGSSDFAVVGAFSSDGGCSWSPPQVVIDHPVLLDADANIVVVGQRVLVTCTTVDFSQGIRTSTTWSVRSEDNGRTWSAPYEIPLGHTYTCGKCQRAIQLKSGTLLLGYSWDVLCEQGQVHQSEGAMDLRAGVMRSTDGGLTWAAGGDTHATYEKIGFPYTGGQASYPSCVQTDEGALVAVWQQDVPGGRDIRMARFSPAWVLDAGAAQGASGKPPYDTGAVDGHNIVLKDYVTAVRPLAECEQVPLVDVYRILSEYAQQHSYAEVLLDGAHPNDFGHRLIADELLKVIPGMLQAP